MVRIREAGPDDRAAVRNVLDGADLVVDDERLVTGLANGDVLVAESERRGTVLGALLRDGSEVLAVAVRLRRRDQGIGSALVRSAMADRERLVAEFDPPVRAFWESLGFEIMAAGEGDRLHGVRESSDQ